MNEKSHQIFHFLSTMAGRGPSHYWPFWPYCTAADPGFSWFQGLFKVQPMLLRLGTLRKDTFLPKESIHSHFGAVF